MSLTKLQSRTLIRELIDDADARWWSNTNLDLLTGLVLDDLWAELLELDARANSRHQLLSSISSPGYIALSGPVPTLTERFYRIQSIVRNAQEYTPIDGRNIIIQDNVVKVAEGRNQFVYFLRSDADEKQCWLLPLDTTTDVDLWYSYLPAAYTSLIDGSGVNFPDGFETAYIYETAARASNKGNTQSVTAYRAQALDTMQKCKASLRKYAGPQVLYDGMPPLALGSE